MNREIKLSQERHGGELFLDKLLIEAKSVPRNGKLVLDIAEVSWINEIQLSILPFILSYLRKENLIDVKVLYEIKGLLDKDTFFEYLYATGFFEFLSYEGITIDTGRPLIEGQPLRPFLEFQSFRNIVSRDKDNTAKIAGFQKEFSRTIRTFFKNEIIENTSIADKLARVIAKELIENINIHSKSDLALVRFRYFSKESDFDEFQRNYCNIPAIRNFYKNNINSPLFLITVSDNGEGIISTLKNNYTSDPPKFVPKTGEDLTKMIEQTSSWWLKKAFDSHQPKEASWRLRLGLHDIFETIREYNGLLFVRCENASVYYDTQDGKENDLRAEFGLPFIKGTHYLIALPAQVNKKNIVNCVEFSDASTGLYVETIGEASNIEYVNFDMSYSYQKAMEIARSATGSYNRPKELVNALSKELEDNIFDKKRLLVIDFSNAIHSNANNYSFALKQLVDRYEGKIGRYCIIRNASKYLIEKIAHPNSVLADALRRSESFLLCFDTLDRIYILGAPDDAIEKDLLSIYARAYAKIKHLEGRTVSLIKNNNFLAKIVALKSDAGAEYIAYFVDFRSIFKTYFDIRVNKERIKSGALLEGHYCIKSTYHVDNYLNAPLMFQNPEICRMFAKEIAKEIMRIDKPDILLTYSTTGLIIYYYIKKYYIANIKLMLVNNVEDLSCQYGTLIQKDERVLILIDVKATGELLAALRYETAKLSGNADNIVKEIAIFDVNSGIRIASDRFKALYSGIEIPYIDKAACSCKEDKEFILNIEPSTGAPSIYQESYSNLSIHLLKKRLIAEVSEIEGIKRNEFLSKIDDNAVPFILLKKHWKELEGCFKIGHIRRKDTHFEHYDMPEELLFRNDTLEGLELYISEFVWSFEKDNFIDFIIYPSDLTAALLGHIVASRFVKKPIVAEARRFESGVFGLPTNIINKMRGKNVLLVDDAINTGTTVLQLIGLIKIYGGNVEGIFTITHRSTAELEMILRALVPRIACAYKFNLETFKNESNCELCIYQKNLNSKKDTAATEELRRYLLEELEKNKSRDYRVNG